MIYIENSVMYSIILYLFLISVVMYIKPKIMFDNNNEIKKFGIGSEKTIYPLWLVVIILGILSYYIILIFNLINKNYE